MLMRTRCSLHGLVEHELVEVDLGQRCRSGVPSASSRRARSSSSLTVSSMRSSSARHAAATAGQSARSGLRSATSRLVRIDASGLRSSCDASDTNCRCRCDDVSSRSEHRVHRAREPTDLVVGGGLGDAPVDGGCR